MSPAKWTPVRKIVATALGALTTTLVIALGSLAGVSVSSTVAATIVAVASVLAGYLTPAAPPE